MKKTMIMLTVAIWLLGVSSAAALVNVLSRPPVPVADNTPPEPEPVPAPEPPPNLESFKIPGPTVAPKRVRSQVQFRRVKRTEMRCSDWKSMSLGPVDRSVRYCQ